MSEQNLQKYCVNARTHGSYGAITEEFPYEGGPWVKALEAEAALAERDARIAELERKQLSRKELGIIKDALFRQRIRCFDNGWDLDAEDVKTVERKLEEIGR